jgi:uncharacterized YigZ family protein
MDFFNTIEQPAQAEYKDRGSKFVAYSFPIDTPEDFKKHLAELKKEHPKAVHHCFAYRIGTDGKQFRLSDDGEPSGTAGKQIMGQIDSKKATNLCIIVVRYFGGSLLGVPGLINAYKMSSLLVLQMVPVVQKPVLINYSIQFDYTQMNDVMMILKQLHCVILQQETQLFSIFKVGVTKVKRDELLYRIKNLRNVEIMISL